MLHYVLIFLLVYGVDGCLTICHRIMLHENLGEAHRNLQGCMDVVFYDLRPNEDCGGPF